MFILSSILTKTIEKFLLRYRAKVNLAKDKEQEIVKHYCYVLDAELTLAKLKSAIEKDIKTFLKDKKIVIDRRIELSYNSKLDNIEVHEK